MLVSPPNNNGKASKLAEYIDQIYAAAIYKILGLASESNSQPKHVQKHFQLKDKTVRSDDSMQVKFLHILPTIALRKTISRT